MIIELTVLEFFFSFLLKCGLSLDSVVNLVLGYVHLCISRD